MLIYNMKKGSWSLKWTFLCLYFFLWWWKLHPVSIAWVHLGQPDNIVLSYSLIHPETKTSFRSQSLPVRAGFSHHQFYIPRFTCPTFQLAHTHQHNNMTLSKLSDFSLESVTSHQGDAEAGFLNLFWTPGYMSCCQTEAGKIKQAERSPPNTMTDTDSKASPRILVAPNKILFVDPKSHAYI